MPALALVFWNWPTGDDCIATEVSSVFPRESKRHLGIMPLMGQVELSTLQSINVPCLVSPHG